jgi:hypothetical protein
MKPVAHFSARIRSGNRRFPRLSFSSRITVGELEPHQHRTQIGRIELPEMKILDLDDNVKPVHLDDPLGADRPQPVRIQATRDYSWDPARVLGLRAEDCRTWCVEDRRVAPATRLYVLVPGGSSPHKLAAGRSGRSRSRQSESEVHASSCPVCRL